MADSKPGRLEVKRMVGAKPLIFGLAPDIIFPWGIISFLTLAITRSIFTSNYEGWEYTVGLTITGCISWTFLVGKEPHKFLGKFLIAPRRTTCTYQRFTPLRGAKIVSKRHHK
jgi:hypothetical protein